MGFFGNLIGQGLGAIGGRFLPIPGVNGQQVGGAIGGLLPFKKGGRILVRPFKTGGKVKPKAKKAKKAKKTK